jgi:hypothetical protein
MSHRPGNGAGEQAPLLSGGVGTAAGGGGGGGGYGGVSKASGGPDLASTMYHQSSIFHSMGKGLLVVSLMTGSRKRENECQAALFGS